MSSSTKPYFRIDRWRLKQVAPNGRIKGQRRPAKIKAGITISLPRDRSIKVSCGRTDAGEIEGFTVFFLGTQILMHFKNTGGLSRLIIDELGYDRALELSLISPNTPREAPKPVS